MEETRIVSNPLSSELTGCQWKARLPRGLYKLLLLLGLSKFQLTSGSRPIHAHLTYVNRYAPFKHHCPHAAYVCVFAVLTCSIFAGWQRLTVLKHQCCPDFHMSNFMTDLLEVPVAMPSWGAVADVFAIAYTFALPLFRMFCHFTSVMFLFLSLVACELCCATLPPMLSAGTAPHPLKYAQRACITKGFQKYMQTSLHMQLMGGLIYEEVAMRVASVKWTRFRLTIVTTTDKCAQSN